jgi:hypothetical protein
MSVDGDGAGRVGVAGGYVVNGGEVEDRSGSAGLEAATNAVLIAEVDSLTVAIGAHR